MTWLVAGLGNPGPTYARTRHNAGAMAVEFLASRAGDRFRKARFVPAEVAEAVEGEEAVAEGEGATAEEAEQQAEQAESPGEGEGGGEE